MLTAERSFSLLKLFKTYFKNSMLQDRLTGLWRFCPLTTWQRENSMQSQFLTILFVERRVLLYYNNCSHRQISNRITCSKSQSFGLIQRFKSQRSNLESKSQIIASNLKSCAPNQISNLQKLHTFNVFTNFQKKLFGS